MYNVKKYTPFAVYIYRLILILSVVTVVNCITKSAIHSCNAVPTSNSSVRIVFRVIINDDPVYKIYAFRADSSDTTSTANRVDACVRNTSAITNRSTDAIEFDITVDTNEVSHSCGASVSTGSVKIVFLLFRVYAYSDTIISLADDAYNLQCRMDDLVGTTVSTGKAAVSANSTITLMEPQNGAYLLVRNDISKQPITLASIGDKAILSVEFNPQIELGPDNYGTHFFVGFLGNDAISTASTGEVYLIVLPRYSVRTDVTVTTHYGSDTRNVSDGTPLKIILPNDLMGCSEGGQAEVASKGVEINTYEMEVGVMVCNNQLDTADCYTALPSDVTGTEYYTVSMPAVNEASEFMIIAQEQNTSINITLPVSTGHNVTLNGSVTSAGQMLHVTLNQRQTFHLAQTTNAENTSHVSGYHIATDKKVSVLSGNRRYGNDHMVDQIPPTNKLGTHFVLVPANPGSIQDIRHTTYIVQAVQAGNTVIKRYLTNSTFDSYTITPSKNPPQLIDVAVGSPCELISDKPVIVIQVINPPTGTEGFDPAMVVMPPVNHWSPKYVAYFRGLQYLVSVVFQSEKASKMYTMSGYSIAVIGPKAVNGPTGYVFNTGNRVAGELSIQSSDGITTMMPIMYITNNAALDGIATLPFGYRYPTIDDCYPVGRRGDLRDNDCDGKIDEELINEIDDDGDERIDEDTVLGSAELAGAVGIRPVNCRASGQADFSNNKVIQMTDLNGCVVSSSGPLVPANQFTAQTGTTIGTGLKPKILYSGAFEIAMFVDYPQLFFACDIQYCYSSSDTKCTYNICQNVTIGKREATAANPDNITTNIWVFPYRVNNGSTATELVKGNDVSACFSNTSIQGILVVLLVLLLICFSTAVCFSCLFRRQRNFDKKEKYDPSRIH